LANEIKNLDLLGTEYSSPLYPSGWAAATNTPFRYYKGYPTWEGGTHDPLIIFYPKKIKDKGGIRHQYSYISDILPTTIELVGAKVPAIINGYPQEPIEGISLAYTVEPENKNVPERHTVQYHEMTSSYAIYKDGWKASFSRGGYTFGQRREQPVEEEVHLYHVSEDFNELNDLADKYPEKIKELAEIFESEAWKYNVYPLKDNWVTVNRTVFDNRKQLTLYPAGRSYAEVSGFRFSSNSYSVTAKAEIPANGAEGVLLSTGSASSGISFYVKNKKLIFAYNAGGKQYEVISDKVIPAGDVTFKVDVIYSGERGSNKAVNLYINNEKVGSKDLGTIGGIGGYFAFGGGSIEAGRDFGLSIVPTAYKSPFIFTGNLKEVTVDTEF
jgi:arylsulfatase